jgi:hypothetical protein
VVLNKLQSRNSFRGAPSNSEKQLGIENNGKWKQGNRCQEKEPAQVSPGMMMNKHQHSYTCYEKGSDVPDGAQDDADKAVEEVSYDQSSTLAQIG